MEVKNKTKSMPQKRPEIRNITGLEDLQFPSAKKEIAETHQKTTSRKFPLGIVLLCFVFFSVLGIELAIIYRYDKLNKKLYKIARNWKSKAGQLETDITNTQKQLKRAGIFSVHLIDTRTGLLNNLEKKDDKISLLSLKENNYLTLLGSKNQYVNGIQSKYSSLQDRYRKLKGDNNVALTKIDAIQAQRDVIVKENDKQGTRIRELTKKLLNNIGEQELLVNENIRLKEECDMLVERFKELQKAD